MYMQLFGQACAIALSITSVMLLSREIEHLNRVKSVARESSHQKALAQHAMRGLVWQVALAISAAYLTVHFHAEWMTLIAVAFSCGICWLTFGYTPHNKVLDQARLHRALKIAGLPVPEPEPTTHHDMQQSQTATSNIDAEVPLPEDTQRFDGHKMDTRENKSDPEMGDSNGTAERPCPEDS